MLISIRLGRLALVLSSIAWCQATPSNLQTQQSGQNVANVRYRREATPAIHQSLPAIQVSDTKQHGSSQAHMVDDHLTAVASAPQGRQLFPNEHMDLDQTAHDRPGEYPEQEYMEDPHHPGRFWFRFGLMDAVDEIPGSGGPLEGQGVAQRVDTVPARRDDQVEAQKHEEVQLSGTENEQRWIPSPPLKKESFPPKKVVPVPTKKRESILALHVKPGNSFSVTGNDLPQHLQHQDKDQVLNTNLVLTHAQNPPPPQNQNPQPFQHQNQPPPQHRNPPPPQFQSQPPPQHQNQHPQQQRNPPPSQHRFPPSPSQHRNPPPHQFQNPPPPQHRIPPPPQHGIPPPPQHRNPLPPQHRIPPPPQHQNPQPPQLQNPPFSQQQNPQLFQHQNPPSPQHRNPLPPQNRIPPPSQQRNPLPPQHRNPQPLQHQNLPPPRHRNPPPQHQNRLPPQHGIPPPPQQRNPLPHQHRNPPPPPQHQRPFSHPQGVQGVPHSIPAPINGRPTTPGVIFGNGGGPENAGSQRFQPLRPGTVPGQRQPVPQHGGPILHGRRPPPPRIITAHDRLDRPTGQQPQSYDLTASASLNFGGRQPERPRHPPDVVVGQIRRDAREGIRGGRLVNGLNQNRPSFGPGQGSQVRQTLQAGNQVKLRPNIPHPQAFAQNPGQVAPQRQQSGFGNQRVIIPTPVHHTQTVQRITAATSGQITTGEEARPLTAPPSHSGHFGKPGSSEPVGINIPQAELNRPVAAQNGPGQTESHSGGFAVQPSGQTETAQGHDQTGQASQDSPTNINAPAASGQADPETTPGKGENVGHASSSGVTAPSGQTDNMPGKTSQIQVNIGNPPRILPGDPTRPPPQAAQLGRIPPPQNNQHLPGQPTSGQHGQRQPQLFQNSPNHPRPIPARGPNFPPPGPPNHRSTNSRRDGPPPPLRPHPNAGPYPPPGGPRPYHPSGQPAPPLNAGSYQQGGGPALPNGAHPRPNVGPGGRPGFQPLPNGGGVPAGAPPPPIMDRHDGSSAFHQQYFHGNGGGKHPQAKSYKKGYKQVLAGYEAYHGYPYNVEGHNYGKDYTLGQTFGGHGQGQGHSQGHGQSHGQSHGQGHGQGHGQSQGHGQGYGSQQSYPRIPHTHVPSTSHGSSGHQQSQQHQQEHAHNAEPSKAQVEAEGTSEMSKTEEAKKSSSEKSKDGSGKEKSAKPTKKPLVSSGTYTAPAPPPVHVGDHDHGDHEHGDHGGGHDDNNGHGDHHHRQDDVEYHDDGGYDGYVDANGHDFGRYH